jgi:hypothetical protein
MLILKKADRLALSKNIQKSGVRLFFWTLLFHIFHLKNVDNVLVPEFISFSVRQLHFHGVVILSSVEANLQWLTLNKTNFISFQIVG